MNLFEKILCMFLIFTSGGAVFKALGIIAPYAFPMRSGEAWGYLFAYCIVAILLGIVVVKEEI